MILSPVGWTPRDALITKCDGTTFKTSFSHYHVAGSIQLDDVICASDERDEGKVSVSSRKVYSASQNSKRSEQLNLCSVTIVCTNASRFYCIVLLPSPPLSERRRYFDARRPSVCVSAKPRLHAVGGEGNALFSVLSGWVCDRFSVIISIFLRKTLPF